MYVSASLKSPRRYESRAAKRSNVGVVDRLGGGDRGAGVLAQVVDAPVVDRHADDRAVEHAALLEPVERPEGHHLGEVAGDAERDEHVGRPRLVDRVRRRARWVVVAMPERKPDRALAAITQCG